LGKALNPLCPLPVTSNLLGFFEDTSIVRVLVFQITTELGGRLGKKHVKISKKFFYSYSE
jgi:hypothetical protein